MSFSRHGQIYQSDGLFRPRSEAVSGFAPGLIVSMSLRPAIPRQVGLHQSPPPLHRLKVILIPSAETVNHHPARAAEFSTGEMRNFQPALTFTRKVSQDAPMSTHAHSILRLAQDTGVLEHEPERSTQGSPAEARGAPGRS